MYAFTYNRASGIRQAQNMLGKLWMEVRAELRAEDIDARNQELAARTA